MTKTETDGNLDPALGWQNYFFAFWQKSNKISSMEAKRYRSGSSLCRCRNIVISNT
jgi:hypothetical protein